MQLKVYIFISSVIISSLSFSCNQSQQAKNTDITTASKATKDIEEKITRPVTSDIEQILKKSIDLPILQQYYHIDTHPDRSPLVVIANDKITKDISIEKFGKKVLIINETEAKKQNKAYVIFTKMTIDNITASIEIGYPIEGIICKIEFAKEHNDWLIKNHKLLER